MKLAVLIIVLFLKTFWVSAQIKGVVKDSLSGKPISYVNIWVENEPNGTSSEENGRFSLHLKGEKKLVFSALGYQSKTISSNQIATVFLSPKAFELSEVVVERSKKTNKLQIGKTKRNGFFEPITSPYIDVKYFPFEEKYRQTNFLDQVLIKTKSEIDSACFKIRIYSVNDLGFPDEDLLQQDVIVVVKKGNVTTKVDISSYNLTFPEKGIFVGYEPMIIKRNEYALEGIDYKTKKIVYSHAYSPSFLHNYVDTEYSYSYFYGKWNKQKKYKYMEGSDNLKIFEPAISIILTN